MPTHKRLSRTMLQRIKRRHFPIPSDVLSELVSRFIANMPKAERTDLTRLFFRIEEAHRFYLDFCMHRTEDKLLPCGMWSFAEQLLGSIPTLRQHVPHVKKLLDEWRTCK